MKFLMILKFVAIGIGAAVLGLLLLGLFIYLTVAFGSWIEDRNEEKMRKKGYTNLTVKDGDYTKTDWSKLEDKKK